jgi:flagellar hook-associated protein FlgK
VGLLSGELENKIAQANTLIATLIEQNDVLQKKLDERDKELDKLSSRLSELERE